MTESANNETMDDEEEGEAAPESASEWLAAIVDAEKAFRDYQDRADSVDKEYANLERLANTTRQREMQMFWANVQVLAPSIYSRPPVPVVVPRFKDRVPLHRVASELLERSTVVAFEGENIDSVMRLVRDDLSIVARGCVWVRYETKEENSGLFEKVCIEHVDRKDFLHEPARNWKEVGWVGKRSWMTSEEMRKRFGETSGDAYKNAAFAVRKDANDKDDGKLKAGVWEIWSKSENQVVWVTEGVDVLLDHGAPHLTLEGFFPCPRPAYATVQRGTLNPVPDMAFYKDQLEEINELTGRIHALSEAVKVRGFYPAGAGEIGDAIETAVKSQDGNAVLIPVSNWAMLGSGSVKDMIVWLPLEMIANVITQLVTLRQQLIDDVYQITGLSDIMRGSTKPSETLGAQELKSQYGSIRIRDRQEELVRMARDIARIAAEIMAENFQQKTLQEMSQLEVDTDADIAAQVKQLEGQAKQIMGQLQQAQADPEVQAMAQQNPEQAQQILQQAQEQIGQIRGQITELQGKPTIEKVVKFLRDQRLRPFVLDIETDSTIAPDENATKQRATEFITAVGGFLNQAVQGVTLVPQMAPLMADTLKYVASQFRAGRELDASIDAFADSMKQMAAQPKANPEQDKAQAEAQAKQAEAQSKQALAAAEAQAKQADAQVKMTEAKDKAEENDLARRIREQEAIDAANKRAADLQATQAEATKRIELMGAKRADEAQKHLQDLEIGNLNIRLLQTKIGQAEQATQNSILTTEAGIESTHAKTSAGIAATEAGVEAKRQAAATKQAAP